MSALQYRSIEAFKSMHTPGRTVAEVLAEMRSSNTAVVKAVASEVRAIDKEKRTVDFVISTASVDRERDTISMDGWDTSNFEKNPVVLFAHSHRTPPIGRSLMLSRLDGKLRSKCEFMPREISEFAFMIFQMYAEGYMKATSVGFIPKEYAFDNDRPGGINFLSQELIEYSCVPVPANPEALVEARGKGINTGPLKAWVEQTLDLLHLENPSDATVKSELERLRAFSDPVAGKSYIVLFGETKMPADVTTETPAAPEAEPEVKDANTEEVTDDAAPAADAEPKTVTEPEADAAPASPVKRIVREVVHWECGTDGHAHETEDDAQQCRDVASSVTQALTALGALKGQTLSDDDKAALVRATTDLQLDATTTTTEEEVRECGDELSVRFSDDDSEARGQEESSEDAVVFDPAEVGATVTDAVRGAVNEILGIVD